LKEQADGEATNMFFWIEWNIWRWLKIVENR
jgi:hypothetical protein